MRVICSDLGAHGDEEGMPNGRHDLAREGDPELGVRLQSVLVGRECGETSDQRPQGQHTRAKSHSYLLSETGCLVSATNNL